MELNINNLPDFVKLANVMWDMASDSVQQVARNSGLFKEMPIPQFTGNKREFSEIDLEEYASRKGESDQAERAKVQQGYTKDGILYRVAKDIGISYEFRTQGKYPEIRNRLTNLGKLAPNRLDLDLTHRITFGTLTTYNDRDGVPVDISIGDTQALFTTAHTLRASTTTFRNLLANNPQASQGAVEAMETMRLNNTYNQFGEKMTIKADIIFSTDDPTTCNVISRLLKSTTNPDQSNANVLNVYNRSYKHVVLPRLATDQFGGNDASKAKYWGLASSEMSTGYLGMHEEPRLKEPALGNNGEEFSTDDWNFGTRAGWMIVIVSASWISLSKGDGTA